MPGNSEARSRVETNKQICRRWCVHVHVHGQSTLDIAVALECRDFWSRMSSHLTTASNTRYDTCRHPSTSFLVLAPGKPPKTERERTSQSFFPATSCILCHYLPHYHCHSPGLHTCIGLAAAMPLSLSIFSTVFTRGSGSSILPSFIAPRLLSQSEQSDTSSSSSDFAIRPVCSGHCLASVAGDGTRHH